MSTTIIRTILRCIDVTVRLRHIGTDQRKNMETKAINNQLFVRFSGDISWVDAKPQVGGAKTLHFRTEVLS